nr:hypothetical protein OG513_07720 [Streptomyces sp. NBC_00998]
MSEALNPREPLLSQIDGLTSSICNERCASNCRCIDEERREADGLLDTYTTAVLHEAARRMEAAGMDDDAVAFLDNLARGGWAARCFGCGEPSDNGQAHGYGAEYGGCV